MKRLPASWKDESWRKDPKVFCSSKPTLCLGILKQPLIICSLIFFFVAFSPSWCLLFGTILDLGETGTDPCLVVSERRHVISSRVDSE